MKGERGSSDGSEKKLLPNIFVLAQVEIFFTYTSPFLLDLLLQLLPDHIMSLISHYKYITDQNLKIFFFSKWI
jgi:hypothetical protein